MKKTYSQYREDLIVFDYFNGKVGNLLDLGANDGITFSNSRLLIENGWGGVLVEASPLTFKKLETLYENSSKVICVEKCLSKEKLKTRTKQAATLRSTHFFLLGYWLNGKLRGRCPLRLY